MIVETGIRCVEAIVRDDGRRVSAHRGATPVAYDGWCPHAARHPFPRSGTPWTVAEERRLLELYAEGFRLYPTKSVASIGPGTPSWHAAKTLGRTGSSVQSRYTQLQQCKRRNEGREQDEARNEGSEGGTMISEEFRKGAEAAAGVLDGCGFNATTTHAFRLDDVVLCKLNLTKRARPRQNKEKLDHPKVALVQGMCLALAEVAVLVPTSTREIARAAGITIAFAKACGVDAYDWKRLQKAGVTKGTKAEAEAQLRKEGVR